MPEVCIIFMINTTSRTFAVGDSVCLSVPTAGKVGPQWEGRWKIKSVKGPVTMEITDGQRTRVVHTNRLQHRTQPSPWEQQDTTDMSIDWCFIQLGLNVG